jgi:CheY-like chemotaxis protein
MPTARVLVVDPDRAIRDLLALALTGEGYDVAAAPDGAAALALVAQPEPAAPTVILLDAWRADHGGSAFVRAYRRLPAGNAPIIVMTTGTRAEVSAAAEADGVLEKPFGLGVLFDLVAHHAA